MTADTWYGGPDTVCDECGGWDGVHEDDCTSADREPDVDEDAARELAAMRGWGA